MNRLVIVGNGFDLAHGLPTGYHHFINSYWVGIFQKIKDSKVFDLEHNDEFISCNLNLKNISTIDVLSNLREVNNYFEFRQFIVKCSEEGRRLNDFYSIDFHNSFFKIINDKYSIQNWVDIENEYYKLLKECLKEGGNSKVKKLNEEFEQVKTLLEEYLRREICEKNDFSNSNGKLFSLIQFFNTNYRYLQEKKYLQEFSSKYHPAIKKLNYEFKNLNNSQSYNISNLVNTKGIEIKNLFLTFNYTPTLQGYDRSFVNDDSNYYGNNQILHIHGEIDNLENSINFGFGDEMDDDYKTIEKKNDNEYFENIKSFQYFQNSNYRIMLDFIDSEEFQVYIMGHSCGLSDRILLNKIFEHKHCASIKVFYYEKDGKDNYTEIVQNISRHFNKKEMMREKIVNKSLCQPLPQKIRFGKKENDPQL